MSPGGSKPKHLRHQWDDAIGLSDLSPTEKLLCWALMVWVKLETGRCWPSVAKLARYTGYNERSVYRLLDRLKSKDVIRISKRPVGGGKKGNEYVLRLAGLHARARTIIPDPRSGSDPDPESGEVPDPESSDPGPEVRSPLTLETKDPDLGSDKHPLEVTNEPPPQPTPRGEAGGGGGGVVAAPQGESKETTDKDALGALVAFGVLRSTATDLATRHGQAEVEAGIRWVNKNVSGADSLPAMLVTVLRDGTAKDALVADEKVAAEAAEYERMRIRTQRIDGLAHWTRREASLRGDKALADVHERWNRIQAAWPNAREVAISGVLTDAELLPPESDGWALFDKLLAAATQQTSSPHSPSLPPTSKR